MTAPDPYASLSDDELRELADQALLAGIEAPEGSTEREERFAEHGRIVDAIKLRLMGQWSRERGLPPIS